MDIPHQEQISPAYHLDQWICNNSDPDASIAAAPWWMKADFGPRHRHYVILSREDALRQARCLYRKKENRIFVNKADHSWMHHVYCLLVSQVQDMSS